jgi:hypothetical protein
MKTLSMIALFVVLFSWQIAAQVRGADADSTVAPAQTKAEAANPPGTEQKAGSPQSLRAGGCGKCAATAKLPDATAELPTLRPIPGTNENVLVGRIENLIPIGVLTVLGCEKCSAEAVNWALRQGSSFDDIERALQTVAAMQKLDCFKEQFGPEIASRLDKPLAAAKAALEQARTRAAN